MTPHCDLSLETLTALHEHALPWWQALALKNHTRRCTSCQAQLIHFTKLDHQLRTLAPIPAEITPLFHQRHRRALLASGAILAALGLGTWRFFTPEITWDDVEKAMSEVKTVHWKRTLVTYPKPTEPAMPFLEKLVQMTDITLRKEPEIVRATYACSMEQKCRLAIPLTVTVSNLNPPFLGADFSDREFGRNILSTLMFPSDTLPTATVRLWRGRRVIAFSPQRPMMPWQAQYEIWKKDTVLVDPTTRRVLWRERAPGLNSHETDEVTHYNAPITPEFSQKATLTIGFWYALPKEERKRLFTTIQSHLERIHQMQLMPRPDGGLSIWGENVNPSTGKQQFPEEPLCLTIELSGNKHCLRVQKQPDGSFKEVE